MNVIQDKKCKTTQCDVNSIVTPHHPTASKYKLNNAEILKQEQDKSK